MEKVPKWVARFLLPEIETVIRGEAKDLMTYIDDWLRGLHEKEFDERLSLR